MTASRNHEPKPSVVNQGELAPTDFENGTARKGRNTTSHKGLPYHRACLSSPMKIKFCAGEETLFEFDGATAVIKCAALKSATSVLVPIEGDPLTFKFSSFIEHLSVPSAGASNSRMAEAGGESISARGGV